MNVLEGRPGISIQAWYPIVSFGAGTFTIVTVYAQVFIDHQGVGCISQALFHQETN